MVTPVRASLVPDRANELEAVPFSDKGLFVAGRGRQKVGGQRSKHPHAAHVEEDGTPPDGFLQTMLLLHVLDVQDSRAKNVIRPRDPERRLEFGSAQLLSYLLGNECRASPHLEGTRLRIH